MCSALTANQNKMTLSCAVTYITKLYCTIHINLVLSLGILSLDKYFREKFRNPTGLDSFRTDSDDTSSLEMGIYGLLNIVV